MKLVIQGALVILLVSQGVILGILRPCQAEVFVSKMAMMLSSSHVDCFVMPRNLPCYHQHINSCPTEFLGPTRSCIISHRYGIIPHRSST